MTSPSRDRPDSEAALRELDRDAGGPQTRARPPIPGEPTFRATKPTSVRPSAGVLIALLTVTSCAHLSPGDALEESRRRTAEARQAVEGLAVLVDTARSLCSQIGDSPPACATIEQVPIAEAREALSRADEAQQIAQDVLDALAPYAEAAHQILAEVE